mgnify:CR=1 FL=1
MKKEQIIKVANKVLKSLYEFWEDDSPVVKSQKKVIKYITMKGKK